MPKAKPYSGPVDDNLAAQLLNSTSIQVEGVPLGDELLKAAAHLRDVIDQANQALEKSEFAKIVAEHQASKLHRRGNAEILVSETGKVELYIGYENQPARTTAAKRQRRVPLMDDLKKRADRLGVDISEFGIKRKKIFEYLEEVEFGDGAVKKAPPKRGRKKAASKKAKKPEIQTADDPPEPDPGEMSAGPDETRVSPLPEEPPPPKRRGFVNTGEAVKPVVVSAGPGELPPDPGSNGVKTAPKGKRPDMKQLVKDSKEVDIGDLLSSEPPKQ
jgi:hypothetical protein